MQSIEFIKTTEPEISNIEKTLDKIEEQHIEISEKMTNLQTEISEVEKLMNDADLKDLKKQGWQVVQTLLRFVIDGDQIKDLEVIELEKR